MFLSREVEKLYDAFSGEVYKPGKLDGKTKELIAIAASVMADCVPCIEYHYRRAVENGASREEISEAFAISISISSGSKKAKYSPQLEQLAGQS